MLKILRWRNVEYVRKWITYVRISQSLSLTFSIAEEQIADFSECSLLSRKVPRLSRVCGDRSASDIVAVRSIMPKLLKIVGHHSSDERFMFAHVQFQVSKTFLEPIVISSRTHTPYGVS